MQENNYPLTRGRIIALLFLYFVIYMLILPVMFSVAAIKNNPESTYLPLVYQSGIYISTLLPALYLAYPLLKNERHFNGLKAIQTALFGIFLAFGLNLIFSIIMFNIGGPASSENQNALNQISLENPMLYAVTVGFLAPMLEEIIFRGVIFKGMRFKYGFLIALFISSLLFGFVHVSASFFTGNLTDTIYLFLYGGLGCLLAWSYEVNQSIWACIIFHSLYNLLAFALMFA